MRTSILSAAVAAVLMAGLPAVANAQTVIRYAVAPAPVYTYPVDGYVSGYPVYSTYSYPVYGYPVYAYPAYSYSVYPANTYATYPTYSGFSVGFGYSPGYRWGGYYGGWGRGWGGRYGGWGGRHR